MLIFFVVEISLRLISFTKLFSILFFWNISESSVTPGSALRTHVTDADIHLHLILICSWAVYFLLCLYPELYTAPLKNRSTSESKDAELMTMMNKFNVFTNLILLQSVRSPVHSHSATPTLKVCFPVHIINGVGKAKIS